jgi:hypothetical protein
MLPYHTLTIQIRRMWDCKTEEAQIQAEEQRQAPFSLDEREKDDLRQSVLPQEEQERRLHQQQQQQQQQQQEQQEQQQQLLLQQQHQLQQRQRLLQQQQQSWSSQLEFTASSDYPDEKSGFALLVSVFLAYCHFQNVSFAYSYFYFYFKRPHLYFKYMSSCYCYF